MPSELVGVAGFEPAASSSRSQRARWPTTTLTLSDLPRTVRGRPLASAGVCGRCYSFSYSPAKGPGLWPGACAPLSGETRRGADLRQAAGAANAVCPRAIARDYDAPIS
jgi:hypothetical protein